MRLALLLLMAALAGCASHKRQTAAEIFLLRLSTLCGQTFEGRLVSTDAADAEMQGKPLIMQVQGCGPGGVRIPFAVGEDRSRTWVISRTGSNLRLKHEHRHPDGLEDPRSQYGGEAVQPADPDRIEFPADAASKAMFVEQGIPQSAANVWVLELQPGQLFAYELRRPGRHFRVEFNLAG
ncbi:MAG: hypothetical protein KY446_06200 [Proteobacteria bacterium]|nr:hypothetical protein [Pseudomonadota bacterium]MBW3617334.1 hypothetical protein [Pseudomonadota bacterium]